MKNKYPILFCIMILTGVLCFFGCGDQSYFQSGSSSDSLSEKAGEEETDESADESETGDEISPELCYVHVCGAVMSPGVYALPAGSRVYEAIALAGGLTEEALDTGLNQAQEITDGQQIYVCTRQEAQDGNSHMSDSAGQETSDGRININTATKEQLMTLSGIGETRALAIIAYRQEHGGFSSVEEIKNISGIKDAVYQKIADSIKVS